MILDFSCFTFEINSTRIFSDVGLWSLFVAATAWYRLVLDLQASASSVFREDCGVGEWAGPASVSMAAAAL